MLTILNVDGMSCEHCVKAVKDAAESVDGVMGATVSLEKKTAEIEHGEDVSIELIIQAIEEEGYEVAQQ